MDDRQATVLLRRFRSSHAREAWVEFLHSYSTQVLQIIRWFERDPDGVAECYLFVCQQLSRKNFLRLRRFRPEGPASFVTWLRAVVRNLCLDWERKQSGRRHVFRSIERLAHRDREVFHCLYERGLSAEQTFLELGGRFPGISGEEIAESSNRIEQSLTPGQRHLIASNRPRFEPLEPSAQGNDHHAPTQIPNGTPTPEALASLQEQKARLTRELTNLTARDRTLLRLRFEHELTLEQIGRVTRLGSPQTVDRRIKEILGRLKEAIA